MQLVLITGMSGSGKSVALNALEDSGYYCVDNLPPQLLDDFVRLELTHRTPRVAVAMDVRSANHLHQLPDHLHDMLQRHLGEVKLQCLFLETTTDTLVRRFSETRRRHPLSLRASASGDEHQALVDAIEQERDLLANLRERAHVLDTSLLRAAQLRSEVKAWLSTEQARLTLVFESFAFKRGIPMDADYVFDVRMLPNPHYEANLRHQTGRDPGVIAFLQREAAVLRMLDHIDDFLQAWLPEMLADHRSYVTVAIGCTGGQHRSVYLAEQLTHRFAKQWPTRARHREAELWGKGVGGG
jgi:RNase adapter protein RapZ